ncbi:MAG: hypothetical protein M3439_13680 [Chloroflexota bacterium]|nr:hypothetical protein [Chloroflexota bacterium]
MVQTFSKPQEARQIEARARARRRGVRVSVIDPGNAYNTLSQSLPGTVYTIARTRQGWTCECAGFHYTGGCMHVATVERRAEREGWDFGVIAAIVRDDTPEPRRPDPALGLAAIMAPRKVAA